MIILSRYESTLERGLFKALHELRGEAVPLPEAGDIEVSVSEPDGLALDGRTMEVRSADRNGGAELIRSDLPSADGRTGRLKCFCENTQGIFVRLGSSSRRHGTELRLQLWAKNGRALSVESDQPGS